MINALLSEKIIKEKLSKPVLYDKNQIIFYETDLCTKIGIILKGKIKLVHYTLKGEEINLSELKAGDIFGDMIIHANQPYYPGYLIALDQTEVVYISKRSLETLFSQSPLFTKQYIANISKKAALINYHHKILSMPSLQEKILYYIETQMKTNNTSKISFTNITKMAEYFHVKRPSLSRKLNQLKRQNIIDYDKKQIWLQTKQKL